MFIRSLALAILSAIALSAAAAPARAQDRDVPYWASIRASELNMRVGPSADYKIVWVYRRPGLPVRVLRVMEGWRLIEDPDGEQGWVVARLLSPDNTAIVTEGPPVAMREAPAPDGDMKWRLEPGVSGELGECSAGWCELRLDDAHSGWVEQARLWGGGES